MVNMYGSCRMYAHCLISGHCAASSYLVHCNVIRELYVADWSYHVKRRKLPVVIYKHTVIWIIRLTRLREHLYVS